MMYVCMRSSYLNYDNFWSYVGDVMKLSRACFGHFQCTLSLAQLKNCNWLQRNHKYIIIYVWSVNNYFGNFRRPNICAMIKITNVTFTPAVHTMKKWHLAGRWSQGGEGGGRDGGGRRGKRRQEGHHWQVSNLSPPYLLTPQPPLSRSL